MDPSVNLYDKLPDFASEENRKKQALLIQKNQELSSLTSECDELNERLKIINEHLKSVQSEVTATEQILVAKQKEVETEKHLTELANREHGKIISELQKIEEKTNDVQAKASVIEAKTFQSQQRIDKYKEEAQINEQELEQWVQAARDKEEDYMVLQRYLKEDEGRIRSMLLDNEKATSLLDQKKTELDQEITNTRALQIELDTVADQFRKLHEERSDLLNKWQTTLSQMKTLNDDIDKTTQAYESRKDDVSKLQKNVQEQKKNLEQAELENQKYERQLTIGDQEVSSKHKKLEINSTNLAEFKETVETQRHHLGKLESDANAHQTEINALKEKTQQENNKREAYLIRLKETRNALNVQTDSTDELNQQTNVMNEFLKKEELHKKDLESQIDAQKNMIYKLSQEVYSARRNEKNLLAEIEGSQNRAKNLQLKIEQNDRNTQKQMELLYNSNFQIQQMERKIARIEGDRTEEEKLELQTQIDHLTKILDSKIENEKMMTQQLHRLDLDLRQANRKRTKLQENKQDLETRLTELRLDQDSLDKSTLKAKTAKENTLVQINILRLQVEKLSEQVNVKCDELVSLENRRQQLQLSMEERIMEIDNHLAVLRTQLKTEEEAKHAAAIELKERQKREQTLAAKYEVVMGKYKVEGEEVTQTYHVIKFAQEREEVSKRGDELDKQVKKAVRELRALEKAMNKLNGQNTEFRNAFTAIGENDQDVERKKNLEEQKNVVLRRLNSRKAEAQSVADERKQLENTYEHHQASIKNMQDEISKLEPQLKKVQTESKELKDKIKRASNALNKAKETHRKEKAVDMAAPYPSTLIEMDIELKSLKNSIDQAVTDLSNLAEVNREITPMLSIGLQQMDLKMKALGPLQRAQTAAGNGKHPSITTPLSSARSGSSQHSNASSRSNRSNASAASRGSTASHASRGSHLSVVSLGSQNSVDSQRSQTSNGSRGSNVTPRRTSIPIRTVKKP